MAVPTDVTVSRQVLAEPDATLNERTWATLADGTPLVTAQRRGKGLVVLFHVTADTRWSDLPLSGTFVDMLKRIVSLAGSIATPDGNAANARGAAREVLPPTRVLDGFGVFGPPPPTARPVPVELRRARKLRSSARLLRTAGRTAGGECAGARRSPGAA